MDHSACTGAAEIARAGAAAVVFAAGGVVWVYAMEHGWGPFGDSAEMHRRRSARLWNRGLILLVGGGGLAALAVALVMAVTGTTLSC